MTHRQGRFPHILQSLENRDVPFSWRVEKMRLSRDKTQIVVNESLTLGGIPAECFAYRLGNRSALEWVLDQYQVTTDKRSSIAGDPNRADDPEYIVRLIGKVITVSVETLRLTAALRTEKPSPQGAAIAHLGAASSAPTHAAGEGGR